MGKMKSLYMDMVEAAYEKGFEDGYNNRSCKINNNYSKDEKGAYYDGYDHGLLDRREKTIE